MAGEAISISISKACPQINPSPDPNPPVAKKKRSLPGTPDPDAEVIALSPKTLMATNRFLCEICGKGFQRDQNLQLHRRGHNLPWKLRQRSSKEPRKRVYVCPEKSCVHHHPSRALGDLTGIKKHFCRKHGEKKWKCDKCSKRYAVQSDWKAHSKTCGTREYRCDCGTIFSRRDSFITHRAFCDALAEETAKISAAASSIQNLTSFHNLNYQFAGGLMRPNMMQPFPPPFKPAATVADHDSELRDHTIPGLSLWMGQGPQTTIDTSSRNNNSSFSDMQQINSLSISALYGDRFASLSNAQQLECQLNLLYGNKIPSLSSGELTNTSLATGSAKEVSSSNSLLESVPTLFSSQDHRHPVPAADMSATALLQRAAQIGVTSSSLPFLHMKLQNSQPQDGSKFDGLFSSSHSGLSFDLGSGLENSIDDFRASNPFVMCSGQHQISQKDDMGGEITRDFLNVGAHTLCSSSGQKRWWGEA